VFSCYNALKLQLRFCCPVKYLTSTPPTFFHFFHLAVWRHRLPLTTQYDGRAKYDEHLTSREQWRKYLELQNDRRILSLISYVLFINMFNIGCVMAAVSFLAYCSIVADVANSKRSPDSVYSSCW
jgi:hypothetical protein